MPIIFAKDGYRFFFYSNEHDPIHVHVCCGGGEAIFDIEGVVELRESQRMKMDELRKALKLVRENQKLIMEKWHEHLD